MKLNGLVRNMAIGTDYDGDEYVDVTVRIHNNTKRIKRELSIGRVKGWLRNE